MDAAFERMVAESLRFEFLSGGVTPMCQAHSTGWRVLPGLVCSQIYRGQNRMMFADEVEIPVSTGSLMLVAAGTYHRVDLVSTTGLARWVHVNYYLIDNLDLFSLVDMPPVAPPALGDAVGEAIAEWIDAQQREDADLLYLSARRQEFGFYLLRLISQVCRIKPDAADQVDQRRRLRRVIDYLHSHFREPLERNDLAKLAGLSPTHFHPTFRQVFGLSPMAYLRQMRMRQAQQQLLATSLSITEIADQVGYEDIFVFSKCFKRSFGVSPTEYRASLHELRG